MFPSPITGEMYYPDSIVNLHKKILKDAGLPHIRFHDLRHTFATLALQNGVDVKTVSSMLGHYDAGFTLRTYTHATRQKQDEAAQTMGSFMAQVMEQKKAQKYRREGKACRPHRTNHRRAFQPLLYKALRRFFVQKDEVAVCLFHCFRPLISPCGSRCGSNNFQDANEGRTSASGKPSRTRCRFGFVRIHTKHLLAESQAK